MILTGEDVDLIDVHRSMSYQSITNTYNTIDPRTYTIVIDLKPISYHHYDPNTLSGSSPKYLMCHTPQ